MVRCNNGNLTGLTYSWAYKREKSLRITIFKFIFLGFFGSLIILYGLQCFTSFMWWKGREAKMFKHSHLIVRAKNFTLVKVFFLD